MTAQAVQAVIISDRLLMALQALSPEQRQQVTDFAEFLAQRQNGSDQGQSRTHQIAHASSQSWVDEISGSFKDDPEFEEVLRYGREFRRADYPGDEDQQAGE